MPYYRSNLAFCCYGTSNLSKIVSFVNVTSKRVSKQFLSEENFNKAKTFPPKQICQVLSIFKDDFFSSFFCPRYLKCWSVQFLKLKLLNDVAFTCFVYKLKSRYFNGHVWFCAILTLQGNKRVSDFLMCSLFYISVIMNWRHSPEFMFKSLLIFYIAQGN